MLFVRGKGKIGYLIGATKAPRRDDPTYSIWDAENSMIMFWLVNSMEPKIGQTYMFLTIAEEIWEVVGETYSNFGNSAQIYEIKTKICEIKLCDQSVTTYYNTLKGCDGKNLISFMSLKGMCHGC